MTDLMPRVRRRERQTDEPRTKRVNLAYNATEFRIIELAAQRAGLTPSSYAARTALAVARGELVPMPTGEGERVKAFTDADVSFNRVGNNLNQVTAVLNQAALIATGEVLSIILAMRAEITDLRAQVGEAAQKLMLAGIEVSTKRKRR